MAEFVNCSSDSSQFVGNSGSSWLCWEVTTLPLRLQDLRLGGAEGLRPQAGPGWLPCGALEERQQGRAGEEGGPEQWGSQNQWSGKTGAQRTPPPPVIPPFNPPFSLCALGALPENSLIFPMF